ncbi:hypothetical protein HHI36_006218 [Cryptolaemus montrouzieri]|uniref:Uncharacterized protein n=1 Tax=Cryptolaemus montrouzieri TaxID=559131 RepID=A0ABD2NWU0_9CUCU
MKSPLLERNLHNYSIISDQVHNENNENNIAFSPYGAGVILIALGEGLQGEGLYEIRRAVHLPYDAHTIRVGLRDIHRHLKSYFIPKEGFLAGITLNNEKVALNPSYTKLLRFYGYDINSFNNALYPDTHVTTTQETTIDGREETTVTLDDKLDISTSTTSIPSITTIIQEITTSTPETVQTTDDKITSTVLPDKTESSDVEINRTVSPEVTETSSPDDQMISTVLSKFTDASPPDEQMSSTEVTETVVPVEKITTTFLPELSETSSIDKQITSTNLPDSTETSTSYEQISTTIVPEAPLITTNKDVEDEISTENFEGSMLTTTDTLSDMGSELYGVLFRPNTSNIEVTVNNRTLGIPSIPRNLMNTFLVNTMRNSNLTSRSQENSSVQDVQKRIALHHEILEITTANILEEITTKSERFDEVVNTPYNPKSISNADEVTQTTTNFPEINSNSTEIIQVRRHIRTLDDHLHSEFSINEERLPSIRAYKVKKTINNFESGIEMEINNRSENVEQETTHPITNLMYNNSLIGTLGTSAVVINNKIFIIDDLSDSDMKTKRENISKNELRRIRSVEDFILSRQYGQHYPFRPPKPYLPDEPPFFW